MEANKENAMHQKKTGQFFILIQRILTFLSLQTIELTVEPQELDVTPNQITEVATIEIPEDDIFNSLPPNVFHADYDEDDYNADLALQIVANCTMVLIIIGLAMIISIFIYLTF